MQMSGAAEKAGRSELTSRRKTTKVPKKSNKTGRVLLVYFCIHYEALI